MGGWPGLFSSLSRITSGASPGSAAAHNLTLFLICLGALSPAVRSVRCGWVSLSLSVCLSLSLSLSISLLSQLMEVLPGGCSLYSEQAKSLFESHLRDIHNTTLQCSTESETIWENFRMMFYHERSVAGSPAIQRILPDHAAPSLSKNIIQDVASSSVRTCRTWLCSRASKKYLRGSTKKGRQHAVPVFVNNARVIRGTRRQSFHPLLFQAPYAASLAHKIHGA